MTFQIINDIKYLNGVEVELDTIPEEAIEERLSTLTIEINNKKQTVSTLLEQRDEVIVHAYKHGFSAIRLGNLIGLTRQRIYEVINKYESKREEE
jgi:hypothetical protein|tara:strand:+ start:262 stop:546 length:285 start_codon:yes stop_codon:yes gene_type:complete